ncbi:hypothetical protein QP568_08020 [Propionimicrobium lymphophilum]|uniref:DUF7768 domain-containing protein n=1 Tax=Propionimicrobium lymphophilum TaxID=33012 RepID=UPI00254CF9C6|nr:DUF4406 domain-containing protein [Propionimicrobium lymphophilum]MDK7734230.1 hypothetical protein [Propionimicrobium lymphophilum]
MMREKKITYICSPYRGDVESNVEAAKQFCSFAASCGRVPIAPHLLFPQFMNDNDPADRALAMEFNHAILSKCDELWVLGGDITEGMETEIGWARSLDIPVQFFDADWNPHTGSTNKHKAQGVGRGQYVPD